MSENYESVRKEWNDAKSDMARSRATIVGILKIIELLEERPITKFVYETSSTTKNTETASKEPSWGI